jgi:hypothetical protein
LIALSGAIGDHWTMSSATFDATIDALEETVSRCAAADDRGGYFAAMYLAVTRTVRARAESGAFEDADRMERFVAAFAGRYLDAERAWRAGDRPSEAWRVAFEASQNWRPIILQHLLLGMNAHINLDLGVTAAAFAEGGVLDAVRIDFDAINDVLAELVDGSQGALDEVSPWMSLVDRVGGSGDEEVIRFSLVAARRQAWSVAERLSPLSGDELVTAVAETDRTAAAVGRVVEHPGLWASGLLLVVRSRERADPGDVMSLLAAVRPP